jgi:hypothetical protein
MLDPGARIHLNLYTGGDVFLLPWKYADIANIVADSNGHVEGEIPTDLVPPGSYRLSFLCESGCSEVDEIPNVTGVLYNGNSYPVALGPAFVVVSGTNAAVSAHWRLPGICCYIDVEGRNLPASSAVDIVLVYGPRYTDGLGVVESIRANVGSNGQLSTAISLPVEVSEYLQMVYVVANHDRVLASTVVTR